MQMKQPICVLINPLALIAASTSTNPTLIEYVLQTVLRQLPIPHQSCWITRESVYHNARQAISVIIIRGLACRQITVRMDISDMRLTIFASLKLCAIRIRSGMSMGKHASQTVPNCNPQNSTTTVSASASVLLTTMATTVKENAS